MVVRSHPLDQFQNVSDVLHKTSAGRTNSDHYGKLTANRMYLNYLREYIRNRKHMKTQIRGDEDLNTFR